MELSGEWRAAPADDELRRLFPDPGFDDSGWEAVTVPSHWRSAPAFAASDGPLLYRRAFATPAPAEGRRSWLVLDGVLYQGDVWLDGGYVGDTEGYFFPHAFEVTDALRARSEHHLAVEVTCAPQRDRARKRNLTGAFQHDDTIDPDWNPGGLWRPVHLVETGPVRIERLRLVCLEASAERAVLALRAVLDSDVARHVGIATTIGGVDHRQDRTLAAGSNRVEWRVTVEQPPLWFPRALGEPVLVDVAVEVVDAASGSTSDARRFRTGLRQVREHNWAFEVNGERLFLKGANLGPTRRDLAAASPSELRRDVELARDAGLDLVRVRAHVSRPELYDAADELGVLVWQDLPLHGGYARATRSQATRQAGELVDLLGHHPSIVQWCGHDEPIAADAQPEGNGARHYLLQALPTWNKSVLDLSIHRALSKADPSRPVRAHSGVFPGPTSGGTDSHLSFGWRYGDERDLPVLAGRFPRLVRFVGEFGAQSVPDAAAFCEPERWPALDWDRLAQHHGLHKPLLDRRVPPREHRSFASWRAATQRYQAMLVRRHVEELRRLKYRPAGGFTVELLADAQPAVSAALLDHERHPKLAYEALVEACRPVIVVADRLPETVVPGQALALDVHVVSDLRHGLDDCRVTATLAWPGGEHTWRWAGHLPPDSCVRAGTISVVVPAPAAGRARPAGWQPSALRLDLTFEHPECAATNRDEAPYR